MSPALTHRQESEPSSHRHWTHRQAHAHACAHACTHIHRHTIHIGTHRHACAQAHTWHTGVTSHQVSPECLSPEWAHTLRPTVSLLPPRHPARAQAPDPPAGKPVSHPAPPHPHPRAGRALSQGLVAFVPPADPGPRGGPAHCTPSAWEAYDPWESRGRCKERAGASQAAKQEVGSLCSSMCVHAHTCMCTHMPVYMCACMLA